MTAGRKPGMPRVAGSGRQTGSINKHTATAKEAFDLAFKGIGGVPAFTTWASDNQSDFYKLYARTLPTNVQAEIAGDIILKWAKGK